MMNKCMMNLYKAVRAAYFYLVEFKLSEVKFLKKVLIGSSSNYV